MIELHEERLAAEGFKARTAAGRTTGYSTAGCAAYLCRQHNTAVNTALLSAQHCCLHREERKKNPENTKMETAASTPVSTAACVAGCAARCNRVSSFPLPFPGSIRNDAGKLAIALAEKLHCSQRCSQEEHPLRKIMKRIEQQGLQSLTDMKKKIIISKAGKFSCAASYATSCAAHGDPEKGMEKRLSRCAESTPAGRNDSARSAFLGRRLRCRETRRLQ